MISRSDLLVDFKKIDGGEVVIWINDTCKVERIGSVTLKFENSIMVT